MAVEIATAMEFVVSFCAFWDLLVYFLFLEKGGWVVVGGGGGGALSWIAPLLPPPLYPSPDKEVFFKFVFWLVVVVGIAAVTEFFCMLLCFLGFSVIFYSGRKVGGALAELTPFPSLPPLDPSKRVLFWY